MQITHHAERWNHGGHRGPSFAPVVMADVVRVWEGPRLNHECEALSTALLMADRIRAASPRTLVHMARDAMQRLFEANRDAPHQVGMTTRQLRLAANVAGLLELAEARLAVEQGATIGRLFPTLTLAERPCGGDAA